jgi:hypothetical protein
LTFSGLGTPKLKQNITQKDRGRLQIAHIRRRVEIDQNIRRIIRKFGLEEILKIISTQII